MRKHLPLAEPFQPYMSDVVPALGTDSLASNLSLDLLAEARALGDRFPAVPKTTLLTMATAAGARVLGRSDLGRLVRGLRPGVLAVAGELGAEEDPADFVLRQPPAQRSWISKRRTDERAGALGRTSAQVPFARGLP